MTAAQSTILIDRTSPEIEQFAWGAIRWLTSGRLHAAAVQTVGEVYVLPRQENPRHFHPNCQEVLYLVAGEAEHTLGAEWVRLRPGDSVLIPTGVPHQMRNVGWEPVRCLIVFSSPDRQTVLCSPTEAA